MAKFDAAFAAARKAGKKTFKWNGKLYNTKLKSETKTAKAPTPTPRPDRETTTASTKPVQGPNKPRLTIPNKKREASYPRPATGGTGYKAGSTISKKVAASENKPVAKPQQGPTPTRAVGIARKDSAISKAVARRENAPKTDLSNEQRKKLIADAASKRPNAATAWAQSLRKK